MALLYEISAEAQHDLFEILRRIAAPSTARLAVNPASHEAAG